MVKYHGLCDNHALALQSDPEKESFTSLEAGREISREWKYVQKFQWFGLVGFTTRNLADRTC